MRRVVFVWYTVGVRTTITVAPDESYLRLLVWQPLCRQGRPFESCAQHQIVEKRCIFLPCLVLFVDYLFFSPFIFPFLFQAHWRVAFSMCFSPTIDFSTYCLRRCHPCCAAALLPVLPTNQCQSHKQHHHLVPSIWRSSGREASSWLYEDSEMCLCRMELKESFGRRDSSRKLVAFTSGIYLR